MGQHAHEHEKGSNAATLDMSVIRTLMQRGLDNSPLEYTIALENMRATINLALSGQDIVIQSIDLSEEATEGDGAREYTVDLAEDATSNREKVIETASALMNLDRKALESEEVPTDFREYIAEHAEEVREYFGKKAEGEGVSLIDGSNIQLLQVSSLLGRLSSRGATRKIILHKESGGNQNNLELSYRHDTEASNEKFLHSLILNGEAVKEEDVRRSLSSIANHLAMAVATMAREKELSISTDAFRRAVKLACAQKKAAKEGADAIERVKEAKELSSQMTMAALEKKGIAEQTGKVVDEQRKIVEEARRVLNKAEAELARLTEIHDEVEAEAKMLDGKARVALARVSAMEARRDEILG